MCTLNINSVYYILSPRYIMNMPHSAILEASVGRTDKTVPAPFARQWLRGHSQPFHFLLIEIGHEVRFNHRLLPRGGHCRACRWQGGLQRRDVRVWRGYAPDHGSKGGVLRTQRLRGPSNVSRKTGPPWKPRANSSPMPFLL
jgi:hypothetical protein